MFFDSTNTFSCKVSADSMYLIYFARTNTKVHGEGLLRAQQTLQSGKGLFVYSRILRNWSRFIDMAVCNISFMSLTTLIGYSLKRGFMQRPWL